MMTLRANETPMKYSVYLGRTPVVEAAGETGEYEDKYSEPKGFFANIAMSGGEAEAREYGLSVDAYQAVVVADLNAFPFGEGAYIWVDSEVRYKADGVPLIESADYIVLKKSNSLNQTKWLLKAVNK